MKRFILGLATFTAAATAAFSAPIPSNTYAEHLVEEVGRTNPEVAAVALNVTPPKAADNVIVAASDSARIGSKSDGAALEVIKGGKLRASINRAGDRLEVRLPLQDVSGSTIGALSVSYAYGAGADRAGLERSAERIRDVLHRRISHVANLLEPYPYDPNTRSDTYAQKLVEETMAQHPELEIFALHATPPGGKDNIIIGSNIGRIGKKADEDDLRAVNTGKANLEVNDAGNRFEVEMQLRDRSGKVIGAVSTVFAYKDGDDKAELHARGEKINAELRNKIPDAASLFNLPD
jgi:hypothetical protein